MKKKISRIILFFLLFSIIPVQSFAANAPINPWNYTQMLGKGLDVDWSKTKDGKEFYNSKTAKDFSDMGIKHVRIRIKDDMDDESFKILDKQINDCIDNNIIPIIAYQADELKNNPSDKNLSNVVKWWKKVAQHYKDYSYLLSFDLIIEVTDSLNKEPKRLNEIYEEIVNEIRKTNPKRILMISPRVRSNPAYLNDLKIPTKHNGYLMAEWHFYASGPSKTNKEKLWTIGTNEEKQIIIDKINLAVDWQKKTGIPTWVGAWMPGDYNDGNNYSVQEQAVFAKFVSSELDKANIPFAVNSDTKFYDRVNNRWNNEMLPVLNAIGFSKDDTSSVVEKKPQWIKDNMGWWLKKSDNSYPKSQWESVHGKWYWFDNNGYMSTGWKYINYQWYYLNSDGSMKTGWLKDSNEKWYYLNEDGSMAVNTNIDSYKLGSDGAWIQ
ncbi:UNVERIFIED_ORG: glycosyl hydrolase family 5 [Clostridium botulinum]